VCVSSVENWEEVLGDALLASDGCGRVLNQEVPSLTILLLLKSLWFSLLQSVIIPKKIGFLIMVFFEVRNKFLIFARYCRLNTDEEVEQTEKLQIVEKSICGFTSLRK
jgi:hypothetical protein